MSRYARLTINNDDETIPLLSAASDTKDEHVSTTATTSTASTPVSVATHGAFIETMKSNDPVLLRVAVFMLLLFLAIGTLYFTLASGSSETTSEAILNALYFSIVTLTTVGYGNIVEGATPGGHLFLAFYSLAGVATVGFGCGIIADASAEWFENRKTKKDANSKAEIDYNDVCSNPRVLQEGLQSDLRTLAIEIGLLLIVLAIGTIMLLVDGGIGTHIDGNATVMEAFFFATVTATTIGFGDITVKTNGGKVCAMFFLLIGPIIFARVLGVIVSFPFNRRKRKMEEHVLTQFGKDLDMGQFKALCEGNQIDGEVTKPEFILKMLIWLGRVDVKDLALCSQKFDLLDRDGDGTLTELDCQNITAARRWVVAIKHVMLANHINRFATGLRKKSMLLEE
eukprot:m.159717 g.159717  ORF g.159717 m.159717 type:complete len:397 (+) comp31151_c0_seq3:232-1422(+)